MLTAMAGLRKVGTQKCLLCALYTATGVLAHAQDPSYGKWGGVTQAMAMGAHFGDLIAHADLTLSCPESKTHEVQISVASQNRE